MTEYWILAGILDGRFAYPRLTQDVCGIPHGLRLACDLAAAGATRVFVVWNADGEPPDLSAIATDRRLVGRARLDVVPTPPHGADGDDIVLVRGDRLFHRDLPKLAHTGPPFAKLGDAVIRADRATARQIVRRAREPGGIAQATRAAVAIALPYAGFTAGADSPRSLRRAERRLVRSLRKPGDGLASRTINRHISLPITHLLARTSIRPNHITLFALALALAGAIALSRGGYAAGVVGMLLVELGSILDGCDGELARLRFEFSRTGQWLDTTVDDLANIAYITGVTANLMDAGVTWAVPVAAIGLGCFLVTQVVQYALLAFVYKSGDLAAIPWALQTGGEGVVPKLAKRDFLVTVFFGFALVDQLAWILGVFATGAAGFLVILFARLIAGARRSP